MTHMRPNVTLRKPVKGTAAKARRARKRLADKTCARCGQPLKTGARFCSGKCHYADRLERNTTRQKPCPVCGKAMAPSGRYERSQITCSASCGYEYRKLRMRKPRHCDHCGVEYWPLRTTRLKFCSKKCYWASISPRPAMLDAECLVCGSKFRRSAGALKRAKRVFCSRACSTKYFRDENSPMYRGDKDPNRGAAWNRRAASIRVKDGYTCRRCGMSEADNKQKLSVDHVRPWRSFDDKDEANDPDNLAALCRKCHSVKTNTVERAYLRGDLVTLNRWIESIQPVSPFTRSA